MTKNTRTFIGVTMILAGAFLLYCGVKNKNPISLLKTVLSGQGPEWADNLDGSQAAIWVNPSKPATTTPPPDNSGTIQV